MELIATLHCETALSDPFTLAIYRREDGTLEVEDPTPTHPVDWESDEPLRTIDDVLAFVKRYEHRVTGMTFPEVG